MLPLSATATRDSTWLSTTCGGAWRLTSVMLMTTIQRIALTYASPLRKAWGHAVRTDPRHRSRAAVPNRSTTPGPGRRIHATGPRHPRWLALGPSLGRRAGRDDDRRARRVRVPGLVPSRSRE